MNLLLVWEKSLEFFSGVEFMNGTIQKKKQGIFWLLAWDVASPRSKTSCCARRALLVVLARKTWCDIGINHQWHVGVGHGLPKRDKPLIVTKVVLQGSSWTTTVNGILKKNGQHDRNDSHIRSSVTLLRSAGVLSPASRTPTNYGKAPGLGLVELFTS